MKISAEELQSMVDMLSATIRRVTGPVSEPRAKALVGLAVSKVFGKPCYVIEDSLCQSLSLRSDWNAERCEELRQRSIGALKPIGRPIRTLPNMEGG